MNTTCRKDDKFVRDEAARYLTSTYLPTQLFDVFNLSKYDSHLYAGILSNLQATSSFQQFKKTDCDSVEIESS